LRLDPFEFFLADTFVDEDANLITERCLDFGYGVAFSGDTVEEKKRWPPIDQVVTRMAELATRDFRTMLRLSRAASLPSRIPFRTNNA